ncbi:MAG: glycosyltransferase [Eubacteriales bacterium]|nr:glycosyltransferase [Eubacteriales bacterium]
MTHLLYCGNKGVFPQILSSFLSLLLRSPGETFEVSILTMNLTRVKENYVALGKKEENLLEEAAQSFSKENHVTVKDITDLYGSEFAHCPNENAYCSPYTLLRLFAGKTERENGKLLYLDADIFFNKDVRMLTDTPLDGYEYAAAPDHYGKYFLSPLYINAGVLLFNMEEARRTGLFEKAREQIKKHKLPFADQDALMRSTTKKKMLPQKFNDQKFLHKSTVVRHFSKRLFYLPYPHIANIKQDNIEKVHKVFHYHQFDDIYEVYKVWLKRYENGN